MNIYFIKTSQIWDTHTDPASRWRYCTKDLPKTAQEKEVTKVASHRNGERCAGVQVVCR